MKKLLLLGMAVSLAAILIVGCSDDDDECPTCPTDPQQGLVFGDMSIDGGELECWGMIVGIDGSVPDVDSIKLNTSLMELEFGGEGISAWNFDYEEPAGSLASGDTVQVTFYMPGATATAQVKLLDYDDDRPTGFNYPTDYPYDTVAIGDSIAVSWNAVSNADWYNVQMAYYYDSLGTHAELRESYYQTVTSIVVPASLLDYNGYVRVYVYPISGPMPDEGGNISGQVLKGAIVSSSYESIRVYVGTGDAWPSSPIDMSSNDPERLSVDRLMDMYQ
ncbi:MAG: hypothetical protein J7J98_02820 [candidate division Zixibacteria bacterium]|nr:hypothetical protein [candidate division Zixibacteria bacterium]